MSKSERGVSRQSRFIHQLLLTGVGTELAPHSRLNTCQGNNARRGGGSAKKWACSFQLARSASRVQVCFGNEQEA